MNGLRVTNSRVSITIELAPYCTQISGFGALLSINSREATFDGVNVVVVLKAIPMPIPKTNTAAKIVKVVTLNIADGTEGLEVVADLLLVLLDLRLIFVLIDI